jgi:hypothetical protein
MTIYKDKNYNTFEIAGAAWTQDYNASSAGQNYAEIQRFFLWNGLGAEYDLAQFGEGRKITLNCYARNLLRQDTAQSGLIEQEYLFIRDEIKVDIQAKYFFSETVSVFAGLRFQDALTFRSKDLTGQIPGYFLGSMKMPRDAIETIDSKFTLSIPAGVNMAW